MAEWPSDVVDLAADPSQEPEEIVTDADAVTGITGSVQMGIGGETELNGAETGGGAEPHFGFSGAYAPIDDALFVDPTDSTIGAASQNAPGQRYSVGFQNEALAAEGVVTEANLTVQDRPTGKSADIDLVD